MTYFLGDIEPAEFARTKGARDKQKRKKSLLNSRLATTAVALGGIGLGAIAGRQLMKMHFARILAPKIKEIDEQVKVLKIQRHARTPDQMTKILSEPPTEARKIVSSRTQDTQTKALAAATITGGALGSIVPLGMLANARGRKAREELIRKSRRSNFNTAEFGRRKGSKDKLPRAKRTKYGPPGQTGEKLSTGWKTAAKTGLTTAGLTVGLSQLLDRKPIGSSLKSGALWGLGTAGVIGGIRTLGWLNSTRSPIKSIREKRQRDAYEYADAKARMRALRRQRQ